MKSHDFAISDCQSVAAPDHKIGSAFKGQLYFQVGQTEGPIRGRPREVGLGMSAVAPSIRGSVGGGRPENFSKINFEIAHFLHFFAN